MKNRITLLVLWLLPFIAIAQNNSYKQVINTLASELTTSISNNGKKTITITDFLNVENNLTELGVDVANSLETAFLKSNNQFKLVSRDELNRILEEQKISRSRITEKENVKRIGQISNVDVIVVGEISSWGEQITVRAKLLDVETANLIGASEGEVTATGVVKQKFEKIIKFVNPPCVDCPPPPPVDPVITASYANFDFKMMPCQQIGQKIVCDLQIVSKGRDGKLSIHTDGRSKMFTSKGNEFLIDKIRIGDYTYDGRAKKEFIGDIPLPSSLEFSGLSEKISYIPKMQVQIHVSANGRDVGNNNLVFRNIPVN